MGMLETVYKDYDLLLAFSLKNISYNDSWTVYQDYVLTVIAYNFLAVNSCSIAKAQVSRSGKQLRKIIFIHF